MLSIKLIDSLFRVRQVRLRLPLIVLLPIALPPNQKPHLAVAKLRIQDLLDLVFGGAFNLVRFRRRGNSAVDFVTLPQRKSVDVEDGVKLT